MEQFSAVMIPSSTNVPEKKLIYKLLVYLIVDIQQFIL